LDLRGECLIMSGRRHVPSATNERGPRARLSSGSAAHDSLHQWPVV